MLRENSRGVVYHNPLFSGMNKGDSAKPGFGFRQLLRRYKKATCLVATISFAIVFVVLPHLSLGGDSFHDGRRGARSPNERANNSVAMCVHVPLCPSHIVCLDCNYHCCHKHSRDRPIHQKQKTFCKEISLLNVG